MAKKQLTINQASEQLKTQLVDLVNNSGLPISNIYYIFKLIENSVENAYYAALNDEAETETEYAPGMEPDEEQMPEEIHSKEELKEKIAAEVENQ